ncbi:alpha-ribazole phosphatase [Paraburkholderia bannensis]|uniref:Alpha-ribazole phosphatase n=1 Tax=Paraburkholderia bannensis TaxID=765414 RepID=A0A7W9WU25_9BURK|nr:MULTISPECIES: alpha-ribazole phosphatase [Paraburkholderia]MBB3258902.1 alpha-ribazole phosphatase [Paraburkholderia sp. WP4_3_2]MBB6103916.1 alpha-ribazole phosphatase [Paraburkholderia bannensis]
MDLVLIRHPAVAVEAGICYGRSDVALAADAEAGAASIAARLAVLGVRAPARIATSPLTRCASVARVLARAHGALVPQEDARLAEMDFGTWEMQRWDGIECTQIDAWAANFLHARDHGGESVAQFDARVTAWFEALGADQTDARATIWAVAHAGVIRTVAARALGVSLERCVRWPLEMAAIVVLRRESSSGEWLLSRWNA